MNNSGSRWRQPCVLQLDDSLTVNDEVVTTSHLLPHIEQERIVTCFSHIDGRCKLVASSHLLFATFSGSHIHHFCATYIATLRHLHLRVHRIEISESVVVPQDAIATARQHHGDSDLSVHLCESSGETTHISVAILELSQTIEELTFW